MFKVNPLLCTDGYKTSHHLMYPQGTQLVFSNFTPRSVKYMPKQAQEIVDLANKRRNEILDEVRSEAEAVKAKIIEQGYAEVEAERKRAKEELRVKVASLAVAGAEKIVGRSIDEAANNDIIDKLVAEL